MTVRKSSSPIINLDELMKLLTKLRTLTATLPATPEYGQTGLTSPQMPQTDSALLEADEEDMFGIGAAMPQDMVRNNFPHRI